MQLVQRSVRTLLKQVAREMDLPLSLVIDIYMSQFKYVSTEMEKGLRGEPDTFSNIMLQYLGTFRISKGAMYHIEKYKLENKDKDGE